jgi:hypothetical protein
LRSQSIAGFAPGATEKQPESRAGHGRWRQRRPPPSRNGADIRVAREIAGDGNPIAAA